MAAIQQLGADALYGLRNLSTPKRATDWRRIPRAVGRSVRVPRTATAVPSQPPSATPSVSSSGSTRIQRKVDKRKEPRGRVRFLDEGERRRLLEACKESPNPHLYLLTLLAISTGMRQGEILGLRWCDLDLDRGVALVLDSKNGDRRAVPLVGPSLDFLSEREAAVEDPRSKVFLGSRGRVSFPYNAWNVALERAGIEDFRFHDCRHTAASYLAQSGARLHEIADILGHRTLAMVKRYAHLTEPHTLGVAQRMADKFLAD